MLLLDKVTAITSHSEWLPGAHITIKMYFHCKLRECPVEDPTAPSHDSTEEGWAVATSIAWYWREDKAPAGSGER